MTIPNIITFGRFLLVPLVVWALLTGEVVVAFVAFMIAGVSDAVDGYIARRFDQHSELGAHLDPVADKALLVATFVMLGHLGALPLWLVTLAVSRDLMILGAVIFASLVERPIAMRPLLVSKANTAMQIALALIALAELAWLGSLPVIHAILVGLVTMLTVASGAAYLREWIAHMLDDEISSPSPRPTVERDSEYRREEEKV